MKQLLTGTSTPLGCTRQAEQGIQGYNFALYSSQAEQVELCLFEPDMPEQRFVMARSGDVWHLWLSDIPQGTTYGYRLSGENPYCNPQKLMLDPYAKSVIGKPDLSSAEKRRWFELTDERDNAMVAPKGEIIATDFDWSGVRKPQRLWSETVIYELHVKGFSQLQKQLPEEIRGTYAALARPQSIAYLKELGITAVELLPINYHIDEPHLQEKGLTNYWGYSPLAMFAVESDYAANIDGMSALTEFKSMVKALHQAGIEVILDVVFNHTAESEQDFPTFSQRGIDNATYYWQKKGDYINWTGCGNMLNLSHPVSRQWVIDCLSYWAEECQVDGFRFDLATVLGRETPEYRQNAVLFKQILQAPVLKNCKFIAEPWDIGDGGYQVGNFPLHFAEWNDRFRDDMCRFWLWKSGELGAFVERFAGSSDIYRKEGGQPHRSINFITAHDGFTLRDLVSYNHKHNEANGEYNRDGRNENYSYNHGVEGLENLPEAEKSAVEKARVLSSLGLLSSLLLANGTPMLLAGDEFGNTQFGNNNAYCQDNEITWLKWENIDRTLLNTVKFLLKLRKQIQSLRQNQWWSEENVRWLNANGDAMSLADWEQKESKAIQIELDGRWLFLINAKAELQGFRLPQGEWELMYHIANIERQENHCVVGNLGFCILQKNYRSDAEMVLIQ
ncbi:MAG: glycogen debranching protein GlgX [Lonepinella koalarum]|nr:glycogen debranching protein GlgX [Lonepinella koalarum]